MEKTKLVAKRVFRYASLLSIISLFIIPPLWSFAGETIKIGVILATTGVYASMGEGEKLAAVLAIKNLNETGGVIGKKLEMIFEDDEGDPGKGSMAIRKLISIDKVVSIFGSNSNIVSHTISLIAEEMKVPMIAAVPSRKVVMGKQFVFHDVPTEDILFELVGEYSQAKGWKKVGILHDATEYGMDLSKGMSEWWVPKSVTPVLAKFSPGASDVSPQWLVLRRENVEGVFLAAGPAKAAAIALKNRKQLGITIPVIVSPSLANNKFLELAGDAAEGIMIVSHYHFGKWTPGQLNLINYMKKEAPDVSLENHHALGWDGIHLLAAAIKKAGSSEPANIRDALERLKNYDGAVGVYNFSPTNHNGHGRGSLTISKVKDGKFAALED